MSVKERLLAAMSVEIVETKISLMRLDDRLIIYLLRTAGFKIPDNAEVAFMVPSGGDYSSMMLDVNKDNPIYVKFKETKNG